MLINEHVTVATSKILLVPYSKHHVPTYHEWMKDPDIQAATASEPLSLAEEYSMQQSWRSDTDKLTFILCLVPEDNVEIQNSTIEVRSMIGDVNMFVSIHEEDDETLSLVAEIELMIALKSFQRKGYGRAALMTFLYYVLQHEQEILTDFPQRDQQTSKTGRFNYLTAKISNGNERSINLFESVGFQKTSAAPNFFGEYELRCSGMNSTTVAKQMKQYGIDGYREGRYAASSD